MIGSLLILISSFSSVEKVWTGTLDDLNPRYLLKLLRNDSESWLETFVGERPLGSGDVLSELLSGDLLRWFRLKFSAFLDCRKLSVFADPFLFSPTSFKWVGLGLVSNKESTNDWIVFIESGIGVGSPIFLLCFST